MARKALRRSVMSLVSLLFVAALIYVGVVALMYVSQPMLMSVPDTTRWSPASVGLPAAQDVELRTADGETVIVWHAPPRGDKPVVLYFQGNGGGLDLRARRFRWLTEDGL